MPYIPQDDRSKFYPSLNELPSILTPGELNYLITEVIHKFLGDSPNYQKYNDAVGALEGAKLELYRRAIAPYEDAAIKRNGDL